MNSIPRPIIAPNLANLRRVPKPQLKGKSTPIHAPASIPNSAPVKTIIPRPIVGKSFIEKNILVIVIVGLGASYLLLKNKRLN